MSIPKIIHYCWFGGGPINPESRKCIESWKKYCPDYKIIEWNEQNFEISQNRYAQQAYEAKKYAFVSDYVRLAVLYRYGGIYLDTDVELVRPLDELLEHKGFIGMEHSAPSPYGRTLLVNTGSGVGAEPGCEMIGKMLAAYRNGITEIILPKACARDLEDLPQDVREKMTFHLVDHLKQVLSLALVD